MSEDYSHLTPDITPLVRVDWEDIYFTLNWEEVPDDGVHPRPEMNEGRLLYKSKTEVVIGGGYSYWEEQWNTIHCYPRGAVTKITVLIDAAPAPKRKLKEIGEE